MTNSKLYEKIRSEDNIFAAIYALKSYVFEPGLLDKDDQALFVALDDVFDNEVINTCMDACKAELKRVLTEDNAFFKASVFFRAKKYDPEEDRILFRPMHTASLTTQICIASILNCLMFGREEDNSTKTLSSLSTLIPHFFYGNLPSTQHEAMFKNWVGCYQDFTEAWQRKLGECLETGEYKYQVKLDMKDFFPSINPEYVLNMVSTLMKPEFDDEDFEMLQIALKKLLVLEIAKMKESECSHYYGHESNTDTSQHFTKGIPQGLPQSYFFANLVMSRVAKRYDEAFGGVTYFYVDDSYTYTSEDSNFNNTIAKLNAQLAKDFSGPFLYGFKEAEKRLFGKFESNVSIHTSGKSTRDEIGLTMKSGTNYLLNVCMDASRVGMEFRSSLNELNETTLSAKIEVWLEALTEELKRVQNPNEAQLDNKEETLKILKRYVRFFKYRLLVIEQQHDANYDDSFTALENDIDTLLDESESENFVQNIMDKLDEDILMARAGKLLSGPANEERKIRLEDRVRNLEQRLAQKSSIQNLYMSKCISFRQVADRERKYKTLRIIMQQRQQGMTKNSLYKTIELLQEYLSESHSPEYVPSYAQFLYDSGCKYRQMVINANISTILNVELSDSLCFYKKNGFMLRYYELRLLAWVRNPYFKAIENQKLLEVANTANMDLGSEKVELSIMEVLDLFVRFVQRPELVDNIIKTHQFLVSIWRNGSKFLHFYTLHNEDHSVELIRACIDIVKTIDYIQLKTYDYYILFLACYLHDIAMVIYPHCLDFVREEKGTDAYYTDAIDKLEEILSDQEGGGGFSDISKGEFKRFMVLCYQKVDEFFESDIRGNHGEESARLIKECKGLDYLEASVRMLVANVSEAHVLEADEVYRRKSTATHDPISLKKLMIVLRLADVLDISKKRVSNQFLKQNIGQMPPISKFHWISHSAVSRCKFYAQYRLDKNESLCESFLDKKRFHEIVCLEIGLNVRNLTSPCAQPTCDDYRATFDSERDEIVITPSKSEDSLCDCCMLPCKWMKDKNNYLFDEILELKDYLKRDGNNNLFQTDFKITLKFDSKQPLDAESLDVVLAHLRLP